MGVHARGAPDRGEPLTASADNDWRARAEALEAELAERSARANEALAEAQRRTYWLDRLHLDLNALMARGAARRLVALLPLARELYRSGFHARESLSRAAGWLRSARNEAAEDAMRAQELAATPSLPAAAEELVGTAPGRTLVLADSDDLRALWPAPADAADSDARFELVVVDDAVGGLGAAEPRVADGGRVLLTTGRPADAVLDSTALGWAVLARRRVGGGRDLYLLRRW